MKYLTFLLALAISAAGCSNDDAGPRGPRTDKIADASEDRGRDPMDAGTPSDAHDDHSARDGSEDGPPPPPWEPDDETTAFDSVYGVIMARCGCHRRSPGRLDMHQESLAYANLVEAMSDNRPDAGCADMVRVVPGDPEASLLYRKVAEIDLCGKRMPPRDALPADEIEIIRAWIEAGAER